MATIRKGIVIRKVFLSIFLPVFLTLIVLSALNVYNFRNYSTNSKTSKNKDIFTDIIKAVEFQDLALNMIEGEIENRLKGFSDKLVNDIYPKMYGVDKANLQYIRKAIGMDIKNEDIYFIDTAGIVVNTTFEKDKNLNFFNFGEKHKKMLLSLFKEKKFISERFTIEASTKRLKKYCYQPTKDGKYLVEIGIYSKAADETVSFIIKRLADFSNTDNGIISVDIFITTDKPFSLNKDAVIDNSHLEYIQKVVASKERQILNMEVDDKILNYEYIYVPLKNTNLYKDAVVRIISDRSGDAVIFTYLAYSLIIFGAIFLLCMFIFFVQVMRHKDYAH
ncbi:MAG: hypothetical protein HY958_06375 [Bacteroidia bacterium]|nr:hypothetical protein [Bacteroidia bacterium]